ncbi:MAG TPA: hypothetical protein DIT26_01745 [Mesotoga infera]|uniref:EF-hand domain-containing protein n=1 Tax=Mesotoga infera TaxID=1236046 RepID=A0A101I9F9_9BACT|nr:MAG: Uncharacterized protein XE02_0146 [Mesotoga infera]HCO69302.1 hypothetical protein [Mesotoga infera]
MRKSFSFLALMVLLVFALSGCFQPQQSVEVINLGNEEYSDNFFFSLQEASGEYVFFIKAPAEKVAVDGEFIGKMTYWVDYETNELVVTHVLEKGWKLTEMWLGYAKELADLDSNSDGTLDKSDLTDHVTVNPKSSSFTYRVDVGTFIDEDTTKFYFATNLFLEKEVEINVLRKEIWRYEHGVCRFHVTYFNENGQKDPWLNGFIDGNAKGSKSGEYDWILTKTASPTVVPNFPSNSATEKQIEYILEAKRLPLKEGTTFSISGSAGVLNSGDATAKNVKVELQLQKAVGATWEDIGSPKKRSLGDIDPGYKSVPFAFSFSGNEGDCIRVSMKITSDNFPTTLVYETFLMPEPAEMQPLDANATVEDQPFPPMGFEVLNHSSAGWPWNIVDTSLATKTYFVTIRSTEQLQAGEYWLTNTATLTESDTKDKRVDNAVVQISVIGGSEDSGTLQATTTHEIMWNREIEYNWELEKRVLPDSVTLTQGASQTFTYTLSATRLETPVASGSDDHGLTGEVEVLFTSAGITTADNLKIHVQLESSMNGSDWSTEGATVSVDTSSKDSFSSGEKHTYPFSIPGFTPIEGKFYRVTAYVKADGPFPTQDTSDHSGPRYPNITKKYDEQANVDDLLGNIKDSGFSMTNIVSHPSWPTDISTNTKYVYSIRIENKSAAQGTYFLTNNATLTEYDSKTEHSDDALVIITVPQESEDILELTVEVSGEFGWEETVRYGWEIDKSVDPSSAELSIGEEEDFEYTLTATRSVEKTTALATITGKATVENMGSLKAEGVLLAITLQYYDGEWKDIQSKGPLNLGDMEVGAGEEEDYEFNFDPTGKSKFRVLATATSGSYSADNDKEFVPGNPEEKYINPSADVEDVFTNFSDFKDYGFSVDPDEEDRSWDDIINHADWVQANSNTWKTSYTITVKNEEAEENLEGYYLDNTVTIYKSGMDEEYDSDDEVVEIKTKLTPTDPETAWAKGDTTFIQLGISSNWGWVFDYKVGQNNSRHELWAGAGQNDTNKGTLVGYVEVYSDSESLYVQYKTIDERGWVILKAHLYVGESNPTTAAPGQLGHQSGDNGQPKISPSGELTYIFRINNVWADGTDLKLAAHAEVAKQM